MIGPIVCVGIDPGDDTVLAVVRLGSGQMPVLVDLFEVYGGPVHWHDRLDEAVHRVFQAEAHPDRVWLEVPEKVIRRSAGLANHRSGIGLGRRIGAVEAIWRQHYGSLPVTVTTGAWWDALAGVVRLHPKSDTGTERIAEASGVVQGAAQRMAEITSADRRVDAAEAILMAAGACFDVREKRARADLLARVVASGQRPPADFMAQVKAADKTRGGSRKRRG